MLAHKLREAMAAELKRHRFNGHVEIDGAYFGGHVRPRTVKTNRHRPPPCRSNQTGKRRVVVVMRERNGRTLPFVFKAEDDGVR